MYKEFSEKELIELANQLSCPRGKNGLAVADQMNKSNISMTLATVQEMNLLELELSELMKEEAERKNDQFIVNGAATFSLYDGVKLPFDNNTFDVIFTVNTLYFWADPIQLLNDLYRVLKKGGTCYITFAQKKFMQGLPFIKDEFTMYDNNDVEVLITKTPFELVRFVDKSELVKSKTGEEVTRDYTIVHLRV